MDRVRWMVRRDMEEVVDIDGRSFRPPWLESAFKSTLKERWNVGLVATKDEAVVGYMIYEVNANRIVILRMAVHPEERRLQYGHELVKRLKGNLTLTRPTLTANVPEENLEAQLFFKSQGFICSEILHGPVEKYAMTYQLPSARKAA